MPALMQDLHSVQAAVMARCPLAGLCDLLQLTGQGNDTQIPGTGLCNWDLLGERLFAEKSGWVCLDY